MARSKIKNLQLKTYTHPESKRINNPPVGLVSSQTDKTSGKTQYEHDPYIDPYLSWAGKKEGVSFEVPNVSLHIHERIDAQRIAKAFLKKKAFTQPSLFEDPFADLPLFKAAHFYEHEQDWSNRLVAGDSLLVMNSLLQKEGLAGKVQMIYIDPPYGIKYNSNFQPFLNKRDVSSNDDKDIPAEPEMIKAFRDTWELGIHSYLTYLRNNLLLVQELLTESGSCFVQIGEENIHLVRTLMDEVFKPENFVSLISVAKTTTPRKLIDNNLFYVIWYAKNKEKIKYHQLYVDKPCDEWARETEGGSWGATINGQDRPLTPEEKANTNILPKGARVYQLSGLTSAGGSSNNPPFEYRGVDYFAGSTNHWKTSVEGLLRLVAEDRIETRGGKPWFKKYHEDFPVKALTNIWTDTSGKANERIYVVQTQNKVIERCLLMTTDPSDLTLDPTCGSGTTAYVAEQWGRRWVSCDTSRVAIALAKQRLMTGKFDYYELAHHEEGVASGFQYRTVSHVTLGSIANDEPPQTETLYDQPVVDRNKIRVTGPFTVEAVPSLRTKPFDGNEAKIIAQGSELARIGHTHNTYQWIDELKATGIRATNNQTISFSNVEPSAGTVSISAIGQVQQPNGQMAGAVVCFGPDYGPLDQRQVEGTISEARNLNPKPEYIVFSAFHFDPEAAKDIDQINNSKSEFKVLKAQMSVDLLTSDLRNKRSSNQSYWLIGQPDVELTKNGDGTYQVNVNGFDYYNPVTGEIESGSEKQIAMWMLDTDYDEQSILPEQVFFPVEDDKRDWTKLAKALNGEVDQELVERFTGTISLPFTAGENKKIAIKIIDNRGIESFVVKVL